MKGLWAMTGSGTYSVAGLISLIIAVLLGFILVHVLKLMRLYLIVIEQHIPFKRFVPAYFRTTLVNLLVPYKLGEIYRIGVFSKITKSVNIGFFSILVDRFFDTLALMIILLPFLAVTKIAISIPVALLAVFLLVIIFSYIMFPSSYNYLNRYIITSRTSKSSMKALHVLEAVHEWYMYVKNLVTGRYGLMMLFSLGAWLVELAVLTGVAKLFGFDFTAESFGDYISSILSTQTTKINGIYTILSVALILIACVISGVVYLISKERKKDK